MEMFEDVLDKAKDVVIAAGKKTGEVVEVSKLKLKCVQLNVQIKQIYEKLGAAVYNMNKNGYGNSELIDSLSEEIDLLLKELDETSSKVADIKNIIICPTCGRKNPSNAYYCLKCGSRIAEEFNGVYTDVVADYDADNTDIDI